jgi:hypothetical protein
MIAHVAAAAEARGRVVIQLRSGRPSPVALEAAVRVAQAFQSGIESLFVEDSQLIDLAGFAFAREISLNGRTSRTICSADMERELRLSFAPIRRQIAALARAAEVPIRERVVRDEPVRALATTCSECGPWNVVALAEPFGTLGSSSLRLVLASVVDATGLVIVGPKARRTSGPVIVAVEELDRLPGMLRAAERLSAVTGGEVIVLLIADNQERLHFMEGQARLLLGERPDLRFALVELQPGASAAAAEALRRMRAGFVISQFGGLIVPDDEDLRPLAAALECPLFLVR